MSKKPAIEAITKIGESYGLLLIWAAFAALHASAKVNISTAQVLQESAPAQIVSIDETVADQGDSLVLKNTSTRLISSLRLGWAIDVPGGCSSAPTATQVNYRTFSVAIQPNAAITLKDLGPYQDLLEKARSEKASVISVEVAVVRVDFADGTSWRSPLPAGQTFDKAIVNDLSHKCSLVN